MPLSTYGSAAIITKRKKDQAQKISLLCFIKCKTMCSAPAPLSKHATFVFYFQQQFRSTCLQKKIKRVCYTKSIHIFVTFTSACTPTCVQNRTKERHFFRWQVSQETEHATHVVHLVQTRVKAVSLHTSASPQSGNQLRRENSLRVKPLYYGTTVDMKYQFSRFVFVKCNAICK